MEDRPIVFTISPLADDTCRIYTRDARVKDGDNDVTVAAAKLTNMMTVMSHILNDDGYAVLFEID